MNRHFASLRVASLMGLMVASFILAAPKTARAQNDEDVRTPMIDAVKVKAAFDQLAAGAVAGKWSARWDVNTRLPRLLRNGVSRAYPGSPGEAVEAFLQDNLKLFEADRPGTTLRVADVTQTHAGIQRITIEQQYRGLLVVHGRMSIAIDDQNRIHYVASTVWPVSPQTTIQPGLTASQSVARGRAIFPEFDGDWESPTLAMYPRGDGVLCYLLSRRLADHVLPWELAIDAATGELLEQRDVIQHADDDRDAAGAARDRAKARLLNSRRADQSPPSPDTESPPALVGPPAPCDRTWVTNGPAGQTVVSSVPGSTDPYLVAIELGTGAFGSAEDETQAEAVYGAGITLLPGIVYTISCDWDLHTWDSYNATFGYWDVFFVHVNSEGFYWSHPLGLPDHVSDNSCSTAYNPWNEDLFGPIWSFGGAQHSNGVLCSSAGSFEFTYFEPNHEKTVYLSVGLDTLVTGAVDGLMPSWGTMVVEITGQTMVFNPNPVTVLHNPMLVDLGNSNTAVPTVAYDVVELTNLTPPTGSDPWMLIGEYAKLAAKPTPVIPPPTGPLTHLVFTPPTSHASTFSYLRGCHGFEAVMAYYHITQNQLYIQSLGYSTINNRQIEIDPHNFSQDNSFYVPSPSGAGYLVFGDGGVDDAEDADVIVHEYGHSIQDNQSPGTFLGANNPTGIVNETRALGEAFGDYWACSFYRFQNELSGFNPALFGDWDATNGMSPNGWRNVNNNRVYPRDLVAGNIHMSGEIWSGTMWGIQMALGRPYADKLALESNWWVPASPSFADAAEAALFADWILTGGANQVGLANAMVPRGIFRRLIVDSAGAGAAITVSEDDVLGVGDGTAPFVRAYRHGQALTLTAPAAHAGRAFRHWRLDSVNQAAGVATLTLTMNDPSPPALQLTRTARAVFTFTGDINGDGQVGVTDLLAVINAWGPCPGPCPPHCPADVNLDCAVNVSDLLLVINNWG